MKRVFLAIALTLGVIGANAQNAEQPEKEVVTFQADTYPQEMSGDNYEGLTKKLTFDRMIPPYGLEVTYDKTVHVIFPSPVRYVDLGSPNLIAGKADGAENVIRVKATVKNQSFGNHRKRLVLHLQREVCGRTAALERGDERFYP